MKQLALIFCLSLISILSYSQWRTESEYVKVDGLERYYEIFVPNTYSEDKIYPVVFVLHGGGGKAKGMINLTRARFNKLANRDDFIVIYPNGYERGWNDGARDTLAAARRENINDVLFFETMIDDLYNKFSISKGNVFVCGISNGGFMAQRLAYELSSKIKGIAVVAANLSMVQSVQKLPENPISVLFMCGTEDPLVPYNGGHVTVFKQKRGEVLSVAESITTWKQTNNCFEKEKEYVFPDLNKRDACTAIKTVWQNAEDEKIKVVDIRVENGGHTWPGGKPYLPKRLIGNTNQDFNGCDEIWEFFQSLM